MPKAPERRVLHRDGVWIERIDLHDPAEAIGFVRLLVDIEAVLELAPALPQTRHAIAVVASRLRSTDALYRLVLCVALLRPEIAVEILFRREVGPPRCVAAGAIVERAQDFRSL